jgi:hypothetical protein
MSKPQFCLDNLVTCTNSRDCSRQRQGENPVVLTAREPRRLHPPQVPARGCHSHSVLPHCLEDVNSLLQHWTQRQAAREIPFWFKQVEKADWHGKWVSAVDRTPIGAGSGDQSELEPKDAHRDQEQEGEKGA